MPDDTTLWPFCAVYDASSGPTARKTLYLAAVTWMDEVGGTPTHVGITGKGYPRGWRGFARMRRTLENDSFENAVSFSLMLALPGAEYIDREFQIEARCNRNLEFAVTWDPKFGVFGSEACQRLARALVAAANPSYGFGGEWFHCFDPVSYALGSTGCLGLPRWDEALAEPVRDWGWNRKHRVYCHGQLRDVYPWNFLTADQLDVPVGDGPTLREWIAARNDRGTLADFVGAVSLWTVPEEHRAAVRAELEAAHRIFDAARWAEEHPDPPLPPPAPPVPQVKKPSAKRQRLIRKLDERGPLVTVKEFFDGNEDEDSLGVNQRDAGRPPLAECRRILEEILARPDVQDVRCFIIDWPDPDEPLDFHEWPYCGAVSILTSAPPETTEEWADRLGAEAGDGWPQSDDPPPGAKKPKRGMTPVRLVWD